MAGVVAVAVDLASATASVQGGEAAGCPTLFVQQLIAALDAAGYPATLKLPISEHPAAGCSDAAGTLAPAAGCSDAAGTIAPIYLHAFIST